MTPSAGSPRRARPTPSPPARRRPSPAPRLAQAVPPRPPPQPQPRVRVERSVAPAQCGRSGGILRRLRGASLLRLANPATAALLALPARLDVVGDAVALRAARRDRSLVRGKARRARLARVAVSARSGNPQSPRGAVRDRGDAGRHRGMAHQRRPRELPGVRAREPAAARRVRPSPGPRRRERRARRSRRSVGIRHPGGSGALPPPALGLLLGHDALELSLEQVALDVALLRRRRRRGMARPPRCARRRARGQRRRAPSPAFPAPPERRVRERAMHAGVRRARVGGSVARNRT